MSEFLCMDLGDSITGAGADYTSRFQNLMDAGRHSMISVSILMSLSKS